MVKTFFEFFVTLEKRQFFGPNLDFLASFRVAAGIGSVVLDEKGTEPSYLDPFTPAQAAGNFIEKVAYHGLGFGFGKIAFRSKRFDELNFVHALLRKI